MVRPARGPRPQPRGLHGRPSRGGRTRDDLPTTRDVPRRVRRPRLPDRFRSGRVRGVRVGHRDRAARGAGRRVAAADGDLHAGHQGRPGRPRRERGVLGRRRHGRCAERRGPARPHARRLRACRGDRPCEGRDPRGHEARVRHRPGDRCDHARRRGAHARLLAVLAGGRVGAGPRAAQLRQAVRARLAHLPGVRVGSSLGRRRRPRCRRRSSRAPGTGTSRRTSG